MKKRDLDNIIEKIPANKLSEAQILYDEMCFIITTTKKLKTEIRKNGTIENFEQGKQKFLRESPASTSYQKYMKTFDTLYKNLIALLPKEDQGNDDGWDNDEI